MFAEQPKRKPKRKQLHQEDEKRDQRDKQYEFSRTALFVAPDGFFGSRRVQFATLAAHHRVPAAYPIREFVEAGGLMSYGTDFLDMWRQTGLYTGKILKGAKPGDLPVLQSTKFEFAINLQTARALGIEVPNALQLLVDEMIE